MGIFEQLLETNKLLLKEIGDIKREVEVLKEINKPVKNINEIILKFKDDDRLSLSMTAKALGVKQTEVINYINIGILKPISETKRIFTAKEVLRYKKASEETYNYGIIVTKRDLTKNKQSKHIKEDVLVRLIEKQKIAQKNY